MPQPQPGQPQPGQPQPGQPQPGQPQPGQPQPGQPDNGGEIYPANPKEAIIFANNIMDSIYRGGAESPVVNQITSMPQEVPPEKGIGMIAGKIVGDMLIQLRGTGRKPAMKIVMGAIDKTISELIEIGETAGVPGISAEIKEPSMAIATNMIDSASKNEGQPGQQQPGQPQPGQPGPGQQQEAPIQMPQAETGGM